MGLVQYIKILLKEKRFQTFPNDFSNYSAILNLIVNHSTPYVRTPIVIVEGNIRTAKNYMKTILLEEKTLRDGLKRATRVIRITWNASSKKTPFQLHHGRKPRLVLTNVVCLENARGQARHETYSTSQRNEQKQKLRQVGRHRGTAKKNSRA